MTPDNEAATPVNLVARGILWTLYDKAEWEHWPEIGEHDWQAVTWEMKRILGELVPDADEFARAYDYLAARADKEPV